MLMKGVSNKYLSIHLSELDEYLAKQVLEQNSPLRITIIKFDTQGNIGVSAINSDLGIEEGGIDFELWPSEYQSLDSVNINDFMTQSVYTSSAYEFFDFMLMYFFNLELLLDFNGSAWRIRILKNSNESNI